MRKLLFYLVLALFNLGQAQMTEENVQQLLNKKIPSHSLQTIDGTTIDLSKMQGKPIVVNFWFAACKPCIEELPLLNHIFEKYAGRVHFIAITFEDKVKVKSFLKTHRFDFVSVVSAKEYISKLGVKYYPKNIFIDKNGIIRKIEGGIPPESTFEDAQLRFESTIRNLF